MARPMRRTLEEIEQDDENISVYTHAFYDRCIYCGMNDCSDCSPAWNN